MKQIVSLGKILVVSFALILFIPSAKSQSMALNYYSTGTGQNLTINYSRLFPYSEFGIGLGWTINTFSHPDDQHKSFYKRQFATKPIDHLNLNLFFHYNIFRNLDNLEPFLFYDFQAKHSATRNRISTSLDTYILSYRGPYYWLDNTIGIGFVVKIIGNWYLTQKTGFGAHFILPSNKIYPEVDQNRLQPRPVWEVIGLVSIGFGYRLI